METAPAEVEFSFPIRQSLRSWSKVSIPLERDQHRLLGAYVFS